MLIYFTYPQQKSKWHYVIRKYVWDENFNVVKKDLHIDKIIDNMGTRKSWQFEGRLFENLYSIRKSLLCPN